MSGKNQKITISVVDSKMHTELLKTEAMQLFSSIVAGIKLSFVFRKVFILCGMDSTPPAPEECYCSYGYFTTKDICRCVDVSLR